MLVSIGIATRSVQANSNLRGESPQPQMGFEQPLQSKWKHT